ncbi:MAG: hypothetical protein HQM09_24270 [Candidatus Riflebacteria bacterium]|nr:hypothetical protein [Candidatus Riflebacteria bacterium]
MKLSRWFLDSKTGRDSVEGAAITVDPGFKGKCIVLIMVTMFFSGFIYWLNGANGAARASARAYACYANMRVLLGAVEMYNMDYGNIIRTFSDADASKDGYLVKSQYLKSPISHPEPSCLYSSTGDISTTTGRIICSTHGSVMDE